MSGAPKLERGHDSVILAIDSASEQAGLALFDGSAVTELSWPAGRSQTTTLLAQLHYLLSLRGLEPDQLAGVAVTIGPGTFNGLRVGLSVAKGLVLGLDLPIVGVPTLAAAALPFAGLGLTVAPLVPAGRGRIVWSVYQEVEGLWTEVSEPRNGTVADVLESLPEALPVIITGEVSTEQATVLDAVDRVWLALPALRARRPAAVAAIGWDRLTAGEIDDPASLEPIYTGRERA
jgi:tRNA threonylcarbamoyladenosine biosynthesis protein TsaB